VLSSYRLTFDARLLVKFGHVKVGELRRRAVQAYVDELVAAGLAAQTIRNIVTALRVLLKWALREELVTTNPCDGLEPPSGGQARNRIAPPAEAIELLGALADPKDRATYATAFFAGLRRGELMALRANGVDLVAKTITVDRAYDPRTQTFGTPKSKARARWASPSCSCRTSRRSTPRATS
jgi:site-specific recombinase XerC